MTDNAFPSRRATFSRIKGPLSTDWYFGFSFRRRHLSVMVMTATKRQDEELSRVLHEGFRL